MAVRTKEELLEAVRGIEGIDEDASITLIEDISDTMSSFNDTENWKQKYEENDAAWKKKYKDRFFSASADEPETFEQDEPKTYAFEDLFKTN